MAEIINDTGLFITDYEESLRKQIRDFAHDLTAELDLPHQEDKWGCVAATGTFIINQVGKREITTVAELDEAMEREPNKPGDSSRLSVEILKRGLSLETHTPFSPLSEPAERLVHGEIEFDEYLKVYASCYGPIAKDDYSLFRDYYEETFIPSWLAREERFKDYKATGQLITYRDSEITKSLLETLVNKGKHVFTTQVTEGETGVHAIDIFRPELTMPAMVFVPATLHENPRMNTEILPLSEWRFNSFKEEAIGAIALWEVDK